MPKWLSPRKADKGVGSGLPGLQMESELSVSYLVQLSSAWGGDSAWRWLWLWKDPGRCPLITELICLASTGYPVLFAAFLELKK